MKTDRHITFRANSREYEQLKNLSKTSGFKMSRVIKLLIDSPESVKTLSNLSNKKSATAKVYQAKTVNAPQN